MKCKYEHDDDCCYSCADQYMCKCKQPCEFLDPMTNADRIRDMSDEELSDFLAYTWATSARAWQKDTGETLHWLKQRAEGE